MLKLEGYGVKLEQLEAKDIEQVRLWRNEPNVVRYMEFREYITPEMQQCWFDTMSMRGDLYFIISSAGKRVGVTNLKDIDKAGRIAELGMFIADESMQNSILPFGAVLLLLDFGFNDLNLKCVKAHILDDNERAIRFNRALGFVPTETVRGGLNRLYLLNKDDYSKSTTRIRKVLNLTTKK